MGSTIRKKRLLIDEQGQQQSNGKIPRHGLERCMLNYPPIRLRCEDDPRCTTGRRNTHGTEVRELLYPWHPWSGRLVHVHGLVDKGSAVFRCSLSGSTSCRLLEVPVWMFDRTLSAWWLALPIAYADFACLLALAKLLEEACTPSQGADMSAALISHETSRGDVHATPVYDISVRSVLEHTQREDTSDAAMADVAGRNTTGVDGTHRAAARRPRQRRERLPVEGGRS